LIRNLAGARRQQKYDIFLQGELSNLIHPSKENPKPYPSRGQGPIGVSFYRCQPSHLILPHAFTNLIYRHFGTKNPSAGQRKVDDKLRQFGIIWHNDSERSAEKLQKNVPFPLSSLSGFNTTTNDDNIPKGGKKMRKMKPEWTPPSLNGQKTVAFYLFC
jgi:hypothetical protein